MAGGCRAARSAPAPESAAAGTPAPLPGRRRPQRPIAEGGNPVRPV